jgi:imidazolonepropionase-like amidohydrolase
MNLQSKQREGMILNEPLWLDSLARAHATGVPVAAGGDIGNRYPHGSNARELMYLVRPSFFPMEALRAGTAIAAKAMKLEHEVGTIEPGKRADLVLFDGDPLSDIESLRDLERILLVLQGGRAVSGKWLDGQQCTDRTRIGG